MDEGSLMTHRGARDAGGAKDAKGRASSRTGSEEQHDEKGAIQQGNAQPTQKGKRNKRTVQRGLGVCAAIRPR